MKFKPHDYQKTVIEKMFENESLAVLLDPGLGKTACSIKSFLDLFDNGYATAMLVICPLRPMLSTWPAEVSKWDEFETLKISVLHGKNKEEALNSPADIYLINPEGLDWLYKELKKMDTCPFDMLVVDESHKFKNTRTKRFKILKKILPKFNSKYLLTGTPAPKGLMDLFGQIYILDEGERLGRFITEYREKYFIPTGYMGYEWKIKKDSEQRIYEKISDITIRLSQKDYLKLPELTIVDHWINLPSNARSEYEELKKECILMLKEGQVTAANAGVLTGKLRQIANGGIYLSEGSRDSLTLHYEKAEYVVDLIEEMSGQQAIVAYEFKHDMERIKHTLKRRLGIEVDHIGSGISSKKIKDAITKFENGENQILLGQTSSISLGYNFQAANNVIMAALTWKLDDYDQLIKRAWRQGQDKPVSVHRILAKATVDKAIVASLNRKDNTQESLLNALKTHLGV